MRLVEFLNEARLDEARVNVNKMPKKMVSIDGDVVTIDLTKKNLKQIEIDNDFSKAIINGKQGFLNIATECEEFEINGVGKTTFSVRPENLTAKFDGEAIISFLRPPRALTTNAALIEIEDVVNNDMYLFSNWDIKDTKIVRISNGTIPDNELIDFLMAFRNLDEITYPTRTAKGQKALVTLYKGRRRSALDEHASAKMKVGPFSNVSVNFWSTGHGDSVVVNGETLTEE